MNRRILHLGSEPPVVFDGRFAEVWIVGMRSNVSQSVIVNLTPGVVYSFLFQQNGVGGFTFAWPAAGVANGMTLNPRPNSLSMQNFIATQPDQMFANMPGTWTQETP